MIFRQVRGRLGSVFISFDVGAIDVDRLNCYSSTFYDIEHFVFAEFFRRNYYIYIYIYVYYLVLLLYPICRIIVKYIYICTYLHTYIHRVIRPSTYNFESRPYSSHRVISLNFLKRYLDSMMANSFLHFADLINPQ